MSDYLETFIFPEGRLIIEQGQEAQERREFRDNAGAGATKSCFPENMEECLTSFIINFTLNIQRKTEKSKFGSGFTVFHARLRRPTPLGRIFEPVFSKAWHTQRKSCLWKDVVEMFSIPRRVPRRFFFLQHSPRCREN